MHPNEMGSARRPKLHLSFGDKPHKDNKKQQHCASPLLTNHELRRLVADMVD